MWPLLPCTGFTLQAGYDATPYKKLYELLTIDLGGGGVANLASMSKSSYMCVKILFYANLGVARPQSSEKFGS